MSKAFKACPLFDAHKSFVRLPMAMQMLGDYPDSKIFLDNTCLQIPDAREDFLYTQSFF
jgi:integrase/recombinase XerD